MWQPDTGSINLESDLALSTADRMMQKLPESTIHLQTIRDIIKPRLAYFWDIISGEIWKHTPIWNFTRSRLNKKAPESEKIFTVPIPAAESVISFL